MNVSPTTLTAEGKLSKAEVKDLTSIRKASETAALVFKAIKGRKVFRHDFNIESLKAGMLRNGLEINDSDYYTVFSSLADEGLVEYKKGQAVIHWTKNALQIAGAALGDQSVDYSSFDDVDATKKFHKVSAKPSRTVNHGHPGRPAKKAGEAPKQQPRDEQGRPLKADGSIDGRFTNPGRRGFRKTKAGTRDLRHSNPGRPTAEDQAPSRTEVAVSTLTEKMGKSLTIDQAVEAYLNAKKQLAAALGQAV